ncbi:hypothetical protein EV184_11248 [Sinorhizobium americanum]|uniref:Uncharacterized protein n=1 Tax=Sinorhizobium americanum TaxID=194963 RepID=A0A4R2BPH0_9HYPH|nr:hypothetical protein EV184_11248 [Sinorhizobium americanum]
MWKAKQKQLAVEQINGHNAKPHPLIIGRAPENTEMLFTPAELYGAMAQCSSRAKMDQRAARAQVQMCRHLIARHVDDKNDRFALLGTAQPQRGSVRCPGGVQGDQGGVQGCFYKDYQGWLQGAGRALSAPQDRFLGCVARLCRRQLNEVGEEGRDIHRSYGEPDSAHRSGGGSFRSEPWLSLRVWSSLVNLDPPQSSCMRSLGRSREGRACRRKNPPPRPRMNALN